MATSLKQTRIGQRGIFNIKWTWITGMLTLINVLITELWALFGQNWPEDFSVSKSEYTSHVFYLSLTTEAERDSQSKKNDDSVFCCTSIQLVLWRDVHGSNWNSPTKVMEHVQWTLIFLRHWFLYTLLHLSPVIKNSKLKCFSKFLINERKPATFIVEKRETEIEKESRNEF